MNMKRYFIELFQYNLWANQRLLKVIAEAQVTDPYILKMMSHLVSAQIIWLHRIEGLPTSPFPIWEVYKLREIESMVDESNTRWMNFFNNYKVETFEEVIHYQNSKNVDQESKLRNIATHVINHSTHHRGQVSSRLRQLDIVPPQLDFILFSREVQ